MLLHVLLCIVTNTPSQVNDFWRIDQETNGILSCWYGHDPPALVASNEQAVELCLWKTALVQTHEPYIRGLICSVKPMFMMTKTYSNFIFTTNTAVHGLCYAAKDGDTIKILEPLFPKTRKESSIQLLQGQHYHAQRRLCYSNQCYVQTRSYDPVEVLLGNVLKHE